MNDDLINPLLRPINFIFSVFKLIIYSVFFFFSSSFLFYLFVCWPYYLNYYHYLDSFLLKIPDSPFRIFFKDEWPWPYLPHPLFPSFSPPSSPPINFIFSLFSISHSFNFLFLFSFPFRQFHFPTLTIITLQVCNYLLWGTYT